MLNVYNWLSIGLDALCHADWNNMHVLNSPSILLSHFKQHFVSINMKYVIRAGRRLAHDNIRRKKKMKQQMWHRNLLAIENVLKPIIRKIYRTLSKIGTKVNGSEQNKSVTLERDVDEIIGTAYARRCFEKYQH